MFMSVEAAKALEQMNAKSIERSNFILDDDWRHIFEEYAKCATHVRTRMKREPWYRAQHVAEIVAVADGENDGAEWVGVFRMQDGYYLTIRAGCDYTGWGCQESGNSDVADNLADAVAFGLTQEERGRLADQLNTVVRA